MVFAKSFYDIDVCDPKGRIIRLDRYKGKTLLVVNIATGCGFREQLQEIEACYLKLKHLDFIPLAFPSNQFYQEPMSDCHIQSYLQETASLTFPIFQKVQVNGHNAHPLFKFLSTKLPGVLGTTSIKWNFTKFFLDRTATPLKRFSPITSMDLVSDVIEYHLSQNSPPPAQGKPD